MGDMKFMMPNDFGIYLHDVPDDQAAVHQGDRWISNGCIRLEDADRFAKWLFGHVPKGKDPKVEENVDLPEPVPVYVTYLTAEGGPDGPKFRPTRTTAIRLCSRATSAMASSRSRRGGGWGGGGGGRRGRFSSATVGIAEPARRTTVDATGVVSQA